MSRLWGSAPGRSHATARSRGPASARAAAPNPATARSCSSFGASSGRVSTPGARCSTSGPPAPPRASCRPGEPSGPPATPPWTWTAGLITGGSGRPTVSGGWTPRASGSGGHVRRDPLQQRPALHAGRPRHPRGGPPVSEAVGVAMVDVDVQVARTTAAASLRRRDPGRFTPPTLRTTDRTASTGATTPGDCGGRG